MPVKVTRGVWYTYRYTYAPPFLVDWRNNITSLIGPAPRSIASPLFPSQCLCGTILLTLYSMVWDCRFQEQGPYLFIGLSCSITFSLLLFFPFFRSIGIGIAGWIFRLIEYKSITPSIALMTFFNNNNNNFFRINVKVRQRNAINPQDALLQLV